MIDLNNPKVVLAALVSAKEKLGDVDRQEFIGGKVSIKDRTYTTASGKFQLALLESGSVVRRRKAS